MNAITPTTVSLLLISDSSDDTEVISSVPASVVRLSDFSYENSTGATFTADLVEDLEMVAGFADDTLRAAGFARIALWLQRRRARLSVAAPGYVAADSEEIDAAVARWAAGAWVDVAEEFAAAAKSRTAV